MPTLARRPAAHQERERLQARRLRAAELLALGVRQAEVVRRLGVSAQAVSVWHARWRQGGTDALRSRGPSGPTPKVSDAQLAKVEQALLEGATANGFVGELWTLDRITLIIERLTGVRHHPAHVWALLHHRLGWTVQRPVRRAAERDQDAIHHWVAADWPRIKANAHRRRACLVFFDESALSLTPNVRRTWAPRGQPPVLVHPFNWKKASMAAALCYGVRGGGAQLCFHIQPGNYDTDSLIQVLGGAAPLPRRREGHAAVGRPAGPPQHRHAGLAEQPAVLAGRGAAAWIRARPQPGRGPVVQPQGGRAG